MDGKIFPSTTPPELKYKPTKETFADAEPLECVPLMSFRDAVSSQAVQVQLRQFCVSFSTILFLQP